MDLANYCAVAFFRVANALVLLRGFPRLELLNICFEINGTHSSLGFAYEGGP